TACASRSTSGARPMPRPSPWRTAGFTSPAPYTASPRGFADAGRAGRARAPRGPGGSDHASLDSWDAGLRDALAVVDSITDAPLPVMGHSKGAGVMMQFVAALPHRVSALISLDGIATRRSMPDVPAHERTKLLAGELARCA